MYYFSIFYFNIYIPVKDLYYQKYLKYKNKYLNLQSQMGGVIDKISDELYYLIYLYKKL